ncbi:E3 ubiquitin-protein ligase UPL4 [Camellia lanceoleosa]|uniref:E3 ubiquitin-protein ligase UPL4 n=1 Tax=Camellia lanceoleosa TaxID=1840588 RepID=A0ACC0G7S3_9ERIC|nr:E3 ubiquitin-protein ligase UPL4 [Camellia lanceoleosa]
MGNRGQKRVETVDEMPADKRACSSLEFKPSSSNSSVQTPINSTNSTPEAHDGDMDTSSSSSGSFRSEAEDEKDSAYGSCDSDGEQRQNSLLRDYQRRRSSGDHGKFKKVLSSLSEDLEESAILAALTELCELLSFCTDSSLSGLMADSLSPILVKLARHESNPDIMLLAIRAITYLCDVHSRSTGFLVRHDVVPALCQRLMAVEYLDVAEQCLQALDKISREQPLACLQSGAIMAVLTYIDFFSTSVQRVALSTVVNLCKKLPSECPAPLMEAVPILCKLLQYEDRQLVENVATCLIKIAERARHTSDMLDELCKHGLIHQATHLIDLNCRTTLCQPVYTGLIGLLVTLASGSIVAVRTLFELNISSILKDILSTYDLSHKMPSPNMVDGHCNQVHEVLKLLNELLPAIVRDLNVPLNMEKEAFLESRPDLLQKFGMDLLPILIQVVNSGANLYVCYGSLSVINKLVYFNKSEMVIELLKDTNISSFLAGVFTRKDHHVLMLALQIVDTLLQKLSDIFSSSFIKEGVFFAIEALVMPDKCSQSMFPMFSSIRLSNDPSKKSAARDVQRCLCYAFDTGRSLSASETRSCNLEKDSVHNLAMQIRTNYFATELLNSEKGLTDILQKLRILAAALTDLVNMSMTKDSHTLHEEDFCSILRQIMAQLTDRDPISTFEFIESGIVKALVNYLSNGQYLRENTEVTGGVNHINDVEKRIEVFGRLILSMDVPLEDFPLLVLTRKLQTALSSVENFPVILSHSYKQRNSYATVPYGRCTSHPCLPVQFMRGEGETCLCDYSKHVLTVDPFSSLDAIERYLWPKVSKNRTKHVKLTVTQALGSLEGSHPQLPSDVSSPGSKSPDLMDSDSMSSDMQDHEENRQDTSSKKETSMSTEYSGSSSNEDVSPKLLFYLEGQQLDQALSLYQALLQQKIKAEHEIVLCKNVESTQPHPTSHNDSGGLNGRRQSASGLPQKKFLVHGCILESAAQMMDLHARRKAILEVEYSEEVGTGLGPTLEFYTLVSHEFQKSGLGMWREDHGLLSGKSFQDEDSGIVVFPCGLFPRPWSSIVSSSSGLEFSEVIKKFVLLGQVIAKALQDGRVLDIPFSKAFYKLILGQELTVYDIYSFDLGLGRALLEFQAVIERKRYLESVCGENSTLKLDSCFRNTTIEDLCLDFTLPGYPDYVLTSGPDPKLVNMMNLEEYVSLIVDATINTGIYRQVEAFKSGFNQVFPIEHLQVFNEAELERLLCGEREFWTSNELLDHIKFDHGYTASSPPIIDLLEIIHEFDREQQRAFLQFVTGAPRLPTGGLASLNPKLTIVRKHCSKGADADLPSVMTCANYLKLPPYSSKEMMKEKLLYAITEGQGSFHLS